MVVVVKEDELAELEVAGDGSGFGGYPFHHVTVAADPVDMIVKELEPRLVEAGGHVLLGDRKTYSIGETLT